MCPLYAPHSHLSSISCSSCCITSRIPLAAELSLEDQQKKKQRSWLPKSNFRERLPQMFSGVHTETKTIILSLFCHSRQLFRGTPRGSCGEWELSFSINRTLDDCRTTTTELLKERSMSQSPIVENATIHSDLFPHLTCCWCWMVLWQISLVSVRQRALIYSVCIAVVRHHPVS